MENHNVLRNALKEAAIREMIVLPNEKEIKINPLIQKRLKDRVNAYIKKKKRKNMIAASITIALVLSISVDAIRKPLFTPIVETIRQYTSISFKVNEGVEEDELDEDVQYEVTYIPKGYQLIDEEKTMLLSMQSYENSNGAILSIKSYKAGYSSIVLDTEDAISEKIIVDGEEVTIYEKEENVYFVYATSYTAILGRICNGGEDAKEEIIKIAKSIKNIKEN